MKCLSCYRPVSSQQARLWQRKILLCARCAELADGAKALLDAAQRRAAAQALQELEQLVLSGKLLESEATALPGFGARDG